MGRREGSSHGLGQWLVPIESGHVDGSAAPVHPLVARKIFLRPSDHVREISGGDGKTEPRHGHADERTCAAPELDEPPRIGARGRQRKRCAALRAMGRNEAFGENARAWPAQPGHAQPRELRQGKGHAIAHVHNARACAGI